MAGVRTILIRMNHVKNALIEVGWKFEIFNLVNKTMIATMGDSKVSYKDDLYELLLTEEDKIYEEDFNELKALIDEYFSLNH